MVRAVPNAGLSLCDLRKKPRIRENILQQFFSIFWGVARGKARRDLTSRLLRKRFLTPLGQQRPEAMRQILETEDHVAVPPMMYADPFYRITYRIKEEIRKHKWIEGEKGRRLSWAQARAEWT